MLVGFHSGDGFPESSTILERLQDPTVHNEGGTFKLDGLKEDGERLAVALKVAGSGHMIVTAVNAASIEEMKPGSFERYLREEGLGHIVEARVQSGESDKPARERYTMTRRRSLSPMRRAKDTRPSSAYPLRSFPRKIRIAYSQENRCPCNCCCVASLSPTWR